MERLVPLGFLFVSFFDFLLVASMIDVRRSVEACATRARTFFGAVALALFAVLLYFGAAMDWLSPRHILG